MTTPEELLVEVDGDGAHPGTIDAVAMLDLASAFFRLLRKHAALSGRTLALQGLQVVDKCVAIRTVTSDPVLAQASTEAVLQIVVGSKPTPRGLISEVRLVREAAKALPDGQHPKIRMGLGVLSPLALPQLAKAPMDSTISLRAKVQRVGGEKPSARFSSVIEDGHFTLQAHESMVASLGAYLYREVDIEALVSRDPEGRIQGGRLLAFHPLDEGSATEAWREWFKGAELVGGDL